MCCSSHIAKLNDEFKSDLTNVLINENKTTIKDLGMQKSGVKNERKIVKNIEKNIDSMIETVNELL